ncbi:MAG TPA: DUF3515 family protein [Dermatophilaceae bacterium]|nr:DUF3515 family protein [Dermatophilaceae bacterium]
MHRRPRLTGGPHTPARQVATAWADPAARSRCVGAALGLGSALLYAVSLTACSTPAVSVTLPDAATDPACAALVDRWPQEVSGLTSRPVSVSSPAARAWGDPAVIAICGYPAPAPSTAECVAVDGVDWVIQRRSDGVQFTSYGRSPAMDVLVPSRYSPEPLLLPAFAAAARSLPETGRHCS